MDLASLIDWANRNEGVLQALALLGGLLAVATSLVRRRSEMPSRRGAGTEGAEALPLRFAGFELDVARSELRRGGEMVELEPKPFALLSYLVDHRDRVVSKAELLDAIWPDVVVGDASLARALAQLRAALGDDSGNARFVKTLRRRGYRFVAVLEEEPERRSCPPISPARVGLAAVGVVGISTGVGWWLRGASIQDASLPLPAEPSIAVLAFDDYSEDADRRYFGRGLADDLITDLAQVPGLFVVARNSSFSYAGESVPVDEIGRALGVRFVLEGSVQVAKGWVRLNSQLIDATTGGHVWAQTFERPYADLFALQDDLSTQVVDAVEVHLTDPERAAILSRGTDNLEAYDLYLRAVDAWYSEYDAETVHAALGHLDRVHEIDPSFARAWALDAVLCGILWSQNETRMLYADEALARARRAAGVAVRLDPHHSVGLGVLAWLRLTDGQVDEASALTERAVAAAPSNAWAHLRRAQVGVARERLDEAKADLLRAERLNPRPSPRFLGAAGYVSFLVRDAGRAAEYGARLAVAQPGSLDAAILEAIGAEGSDAAADALGRLLELYPSANLMDVQTGWAHPSPRARAEVVEALRRAGLPETPFDYRRPLDRALDESALGALFGQRFVGPFRMSFRGTGIRDVHPDGSTVFTHVETGWSVSGTVFTGTSGLCHVSRQHYKGQPDCGPVYALDAGDERGDYVWIRGHVLHFFRLEPIPTP